MAKFIGVKILDDAIPMLAYEARDKGYLIGINPDSAEGYEVTYEGGYKSWSPKDVFEKSYRTVNKMTFGLAIEALKLGKKVAREGWNGKKMFIWLNDYEGCEMVVPDMEDSLPMLPCINMKTADNKSLTGWLASQTDILAEDWFILE